eukprot:TRINITY_DN10766_c0_g2_i1.p1 TRINITY_DN10766_c0_g2~~TRINITY_DN10766_c0_g2_i1.p1  ORF type:complete len:106 (+),score=14.86 TRINITY_DN10766_c0_g2_i1:210-527(+)
MHAMLHECTVRQQQTQSHSNIRWIYRTQCHHRSTTSLTITASLAGQTITPTTTAPALPLLNPAAWRFLCSATTSSDRSYSFIDLPQHSHQSLHTPYTARLPPGGC